MAIVVPVENVAFELDGLTDGCVAYLNSKTGELYTVMEDVVDEAEDGEDSPDDLADWQKEAVQKAREIAESDVWLALPTKFDIHEYSIMERFSESYPDEAHRDQLCGVIRGSGAFQRFKSVLRRSGTEQAWYDFREAAIADIVVGWLEENKIAYERKPGRPG